MTIDPIIAWSLRLGLALLFASAAWHKLSDLPQFEGTVRAYDLVPRLAAPILSRVLPFAELAIAVLLLHGETWGAAALAGSGLLLVYTCAIALNLVRGKRDIDCGCVTSSAKTPLSGALVVRNAVLLAACGALLLPVRARSLVWVDALTVIAALLALSLLWSSAQRLAQTGPALRSQGGFR